MRILIVAGSIVPKEGGLTAHILATQKWLGRSSIETSLVSLGNLSRLQRGLILWGPSLMLGRVFGLPPGLFSFQATRNILGLKSAQKARNDSYSVALAQDIMAYHAVRKRDRIAKNVVLVLHDYFTKTFENQKLVRARGISHHYVRKKELEAYVEAKTIVTVDSRIANYVVESSGVEKSKISVIKNAADCDLFRPRSNKKASKRVLSCEDSFLVFVPRRLVPKNGVEYAVRALAEDSLAGVPILLLIAGLGPEMARILRVAKKLKVLEKLRMLGSVSRGLMVDMYNAADVTVIPSITERGVQEATSISAMEAMSCQCPVVASRIGGLREIITHNVDGILVDERAPDKIAYALKYLYDSSDEREKLGFAARRTALAHWSRFGREILNLVNRTSGNF